ncbi:MAG: hypothetical protein HY318_20570, partial [Armatimonadetes bacterium]|nr:hypothetical protein [Armatimonadota bacterium]
FEKQLDDYGHKPDWWYCNQNEYAAYRYQFLHSSLGARLRKGRSLRFTLVRPVLLDLNDPVPITLEVSGVPRGEIAGIQCVTAACSPSVRDAGPFLFSLAHDRNQALPKKVGMVPPNTQNRAALNDNDTDVDFAGLKSLLHFHEGKLHLMLDNQSGEKLTNLRVTYRLPLAWKDGVVHRRLKDLPPGPTREDVLAPTMRTDDYKFTSGLHFFIAQIDFVRNGEPGRLYASCHWKNEKVDASYPQGGFLRIGPISPKQFDGGRVVSDLKAGKIQTQPWILNDDSRLEWQADDSAFLSPYIDVELIRLNGLWWQKEPGVYVLQTDLHSDRQQQVEFYFLRGAYQAMVLNGEEVSGKPVVQLREGDNPLFLICGASTGAFLRVLKPGTQERVTDIRFVMPQVAPGGEAYLCSTPGPPNRKSLTGKWRVKLTEKLPPSPSIQSPHPDPGLRPEVKLLLAADFDDSTWDELEVPKRWKDYPGDWPDVDGEAVYRRILSIPVEWSGKDLILSLGPIDDFDDAYFNGVPVGHTDRTVPNFYSAPRLYTIPAPLVKPGRNVIAVRIFDHFGDGGFVGERLEMYVAPRE